jgi:hypothetical protein
VLMNQHKLTCLIGAEKSARHENDRLLVCFYSTAGGC